MKAKICLSILTIAHLSTQISRANPRANPALQGKVIGVSDGDTITVLLQAKPVKIRLFGVDTPEKKQSFGERAKQFTSKFVFGKVVSVKPVSKDKWQRVVALVYLGKKCLNEELLKFGMAWHFKRYDKSRRFAHLEEQAKKAKIGIWADPTAIPPWEWRRAHKEHSKGQKGKLSFLADRHTHFKIEIKNDTPSSSEVLLHGNTKSKKFHRPGCKDYNCKHCKVRFKSREEALKAGYKPCGMCKP